MSMTATIRVPAATRDRLALVARSRSESLSAYLTALSREALTAAMIEAAREEAALDEINLAAAAEYALWDGTSSDGVG